MSTLVSVPGPVTCITTYVAPEQHFRLTWSVCGMPLLPLAGHQEACSHGAALRREDPGVSTLHHWPHDCFLPRQGKTLERAPWGHEECVCCPRMNLHPQSAVGTLWREKAQTEGSGRSVGAVRLGCQPPRPWMAACWRHRHHCGTLEPAGRFSRVSSFLPWAMALQQPVACEAL